jgi:hypothetical protein
MEVLDTIVVLSVVSLVVAVGSMLFVSRRVNSREDTEA